MQGAQKLQERGVYRNTLSDEVCSATQQMSVFQQPARATQDIPGVPGVGFGMAEGGSTAVHTRFIHSIVKMNPSEALEDGLGYEDNFLPLREPRDQRFP